MAEVKVPILDVTGKVAEEFWPPELVDLEVNVAAAVAAEVATELPPAVEAEVASALASKLDVSPEQNAQTADYAFALADATGGKVVLADKATAIEFEILPQGAGGGQVAWASKNILRWVNVNDGELTIVEGAGVTFTGDVVTFAKGQGGMAIRRAADDWVISPFVSGSAAPTVTGTTGSPTTGFFTDSGGVTWDFWEFTSSGTLTTDGRIVAKMLLVGGGGGGGGATGGYTGAGAGCGAVLVTPIVLPNGTITITIGGPGAGSWTTGATGGTSSVTGFDNGVEYRAPGGGGGGAWNGNGLAGGIGAGSGGGGGGGYSRGTGTPYNGPVILPYTTGYEGSNAAGGGFGGGGGGAGGAAAGSAGGAAKAVTDFAATTLNPGAGGHANGAATSAEWGTGGAGKYSGDYVGYSGTGGGCRICIPRP